MTLEFTSGFAIIPAFAFERRSFREGVEPDLERAKQASTQKDGNKVRCARCGHHLADFSQTYFLANRCQFTFSNPLGVVFDIHLFKQVHGGQSSGTPVLEHTWFPPYVWCCTYCNECRSHVGWRFEKASSRFFALVLDKIRFDSDYRSFLQ